VDSLKVITLNDSLSRKDEKCFINIIATTLLSKTVPIM